MSEMKFTGHVLEQTEFIKTKNSIKLTGIGFTRNLDLLETYEM